MKQMTATLIEETTKMIVMLDSLLKLFLQASNLGSYPCPFPVLDAISSPMCDNSDIDKIVCLLLECL